LIEVMSVEKKYTRCELFAKSRIGLLPGARTVSDGSPYKSFLRFFSSSHFTILPMS